MSAIAFAAGCAVGLAMHRAGAHRALARGVREFPQMWSMVALKAYLFRCRAEASISANAGDAAVMAVGALALIFVLAVVQGDASPGMSAPQGNARIETPARANGARQQECEAKEDQGPRPLVKQCGPLV